MRAGFSRLAAVSMPRPIFSPVGLAPLLEPSNGLGLGAEREAVEQQRGFILIEGVDGGVSVGGFVATR